jgi:DNA-directed RNA polymerase specialized sigma24 family protein
LGVFGSTVVTRRNGREWSNGVEAQSEWGWLMAPKPTEAVFTEFVEKRGTGLRHAFIARYGPDVGADVMGDVTEYAWRHWGKVSEMQNPSGWLYRVGQSRSRRYLRRPTRLPTPRPVSEPTVEPGLPGALAALPHAQRVAVLLVHGFGYSVREAADIVGVSASTVQQNAARGLSQIRAAMGVTTDA